MERLWQKTMTDPTAELFEQKLEKLYEDTRGGWIKYFNELLEGYDVE